MNGRKGKGRERKGRGIFKNWILPIWTVWICYGHGWLAVGRQGIARETSSWGMAWQSVQPSLVAPFILCFLATVRWAGFLCWILSPGYFCLELANQARTKTSKAWVKINLSFLKLWCKVFCFNDEEVTKTDFQGRNWTEIETEIVSKWNISWEDQSGPFGLLFAYQVEYNLLHILVL